MVFHPTQTIVRWGMLRQNALKIPCSFIQLFLCCTVNMIAQMMMPGCILTLFESKSMLICIPNLWCNKVL